MKFEFTEESPYNLYSVVRYTVEDYRGMTAGSGRWWQILRVLRSTS